MSVEFLTKVVKRYDCFHKDDVKDFSVLVDEMIEKYPDNKEYVFESIGITEKNFNNVKFNNEQFRNALNFYLKEKVRC